MIPLSVPNIKGNEWRYIKECLDTEWVSSAGKYVDKFEEDIKQFTGAKHAVACVNGTSALHISLLLAGVTAGDEVIVPTLTFIAPVNTIRYIGAHPVFMDCDKYYNINTEKVSEFLETNTYARAGFTYNKSTNRRIAAIIPVHVFGNAARMEESRETGREYNIKIIEDATESLGTVYTDGEISGIHAGIIGDLGCLSFNGNKIITTGGGGMILTDNTEYAEKAKYLTTQAKNDELNYIHDEIGFNYRLTNIQAALGVAQLEQLPLFLKQKRDNYLIYKKAVDNIKGLTIEPTPEYAQNNYWMYALQIDEKQYGLNPKQLIQKLADHKIQARPVWQLNHLQKPYKEYQAYKIDKAYTMRESTINIPCSVNLKQEDVEQVIRVLRNG